MDASPWLSHPAQLYNRNADRLIKDWSLRRFGNAAQLLLQAKRTGRPVSVQAVIGQCGFWGADAMLAEGRLRRLGLRRAGNLLNWLLELDLKIKLSHSQTDRAIFAIEELCLRCA